MGHESDLISMETRNGLCSNDRQRGVVVSKLAIAMVILCCITTRGCAGLQEYITAIFPTTANDNGITIMVVPDFDLSNTYAIVFAMVYDFHNTTPAQKGLPLIYVNRNKTIPPSIQPHLFTNQRSEYMFIQFTGNRGICTPQTIASMWFLNPYQSTITPTWFWWSWYDSQHFFGSGTTIGQNVLVSYTDIFEPGFRPTAVWILNYEIPASFMNFTFVNKNYSAQEVYNATSYLYYVEESYQGPVDLTCENGTVPDTNITTTFTGNIDYEDVGLDLSSMTSITFTVHGCVNSVYQQRFVLLYDKDTDNITATAYRAGLGVSTALTSQYYYSLEQGIGVRPYGARARNIIPPCDQSFWLNWENGVLKSGLGNIIGVNVTASWTMPQDTATPINRMKINVNSGNWTWSFPNRYYITELSRTQNQIFVSKKTTDSYVTGCTLNPPIFIPVCEGIHCANICAQNTDCTSFNMRVAAVGCNCELLKFPSTPWAPSAVVDEPGASYWECG